MHVNPGRIRVVRGGEARGSVIYWMSRDQRLRDNWALLYSLEMARRLNEAMAVVFCLVPRFLESTEDRSYGFMLDGLRELEQHLSRLGIAFILSRGDPGDVVPEIIDEYRAGMLVADFSPLRISRTWKSMVADRIDIPFHEVDAHNIVPCWIASQKQEWSAHAFRLKIKKHLAEFLEEFPDPTPPPRPWREGVDNRWKDPGDQNLPGWRIRSGERAAAAQLDRFISVGLDRYADHRNDPTRDAQSGLSPYIHFGQISAQRVALRIMALGGDHTEFLDELIVRRELSDNFCYYNEHYDSMEGMPEWARRTLDEHRHDRRDYIYSHDELEGARTHDELWNAAQREMLLRGKMHGYLRMYWAKKILEWSESPEEALRIAISLNDRYELDGRDPNGYAGCGWCIGGLHDRPFKERPVFGKIRYMSYEGMKRKFDVRRYVDRIFRMANQ